MKTDIFLSDPASLAMRIGLEMEHVQSLFNQINLLIQPQ